jgi:hypothetical protein
VSKRRAKGDGSVYTRKDGRVVGEWTDANGRSRFMLSDEHRLDPLAPLPHFRVIHRSS